MNAGVIRGKFKKDKLDEVIEIYKRDVLAGGTLMTPMGDIPALLQSICTGKVAGRWPHGPANTHCQVGASHRHGRLGQN